MLQKACACGIKEGETAKDKRQTGVDPNDDEQ